MHKIIIMGINPKSFCKICCWIFSFHLCNMALVITSLTELHSYVDIFEPDENK